MEIKSKLNFKLSLLLLISIVFLGTLGNIANACNTSDWKLIFRHDVSNSAVFSTDDEAKKVNENISDPTSVDKYSRLFELENYRDPNDNKFEFKLVYPNKNITNIWKQSSNPVTRTTRGVDGYEAVSIDSTAAGRGGLEHELGTNTFLDGVPNSSTWRWAIGSHRTYTTSTTIPGPGQIVSLVELYVCADETAPSITYQGSTPSDNHYTINNNFIFQTKLIEKNLKKTFMVFDNIKHKIFDSNAFFKLDFDNIISIGEVENSIVKSNIEGNIAGSVNGPSWKKLNEGNGAYEFKTYGDDIKFADNDVFDLNGDYTISIWNYFDTSLAGGNNYRTLFQRRGQNSTIGFMWSWLMPTNNNLYFQYANGATIKTISFPNIKQENTRQLLTYTFNNTTKELRIYVNGVFKGSKILTDYILPQTSDLYIGSYGAGAHTFMGMLDGFTMYNGILSDSEIQNIYNQEINKSYKTYYTKDNAETYNFTVLQELSEGSHTYSINAEDFVGNTGSTNTRTITKDTIAPTATINYSSTNQTNQDVIASLNPSESVIVTNNGGSNTYTFTGNGSFKFEFKDLASNTGEAIATVNNIDKNNPTGYITYSFTLATSGTVTATLTGLSENVTIVNNNGSNIYTFDSNDSFNFKFIDSAGNTGSATATVNNIYPEYQTELSYNNPLLVFPSDIHNYIRTFSDGVNPDKHCIYKTLKVDLGYSGTYAIIPAWTCYTMNGGTTNDLNIYNTIAQKTSNERYKFLFGKANIKTYFDKPIKFVFNKNMFSGVVIGSLSNEPNLYIKHIGGNDYLSDSISHSYYAHCTNGLSDISNSQLIYYNNSYIGYTCEGGDFKVGFDITGSNSNNNTGSSNSGSTSTTTGGTIIYNTYNTYNNYNSSSSSSKKYYYGDDELANNGGNNYNNNNGEYINDLTILVSDDLISQSISKIKSEINKVALKKGISINQDLLDLYIWGRKNYIITYPYYDELYLGKNLDKKTLSIMLSRYANTVTHLDKINSNNLCVFNDINNLDYSTQNYIIESCEYGLFIPDEKNNFNPSIKITRDEFANILLKILGDNKHASAGNKNDIELLKEKGIMTIFDDRQESRETVLTTLLRINNTYGKYEYKGNNKTYVFTKPYKLGYKGIGVRKLQEFLINYGTLKGKSTGYFGKKTLEALYQFQLAEGLITETSPISLRGYMGPKTRDTINKLIQ